MKSKWNIFIWIFAVLLVVNILRGFFGEMVVTESVRQGNLEKSFSAKAVIVKYETLYSSQQGGSAESFVSEGDRVGKGAKLVDVFTGDVDQTLISRLARVNERISVINENMLGGEAFSRDAAKIESELSDSINKVIEAGYQKDMGKVASLKHRIAVLSDRKAVVAGTKDAADNTIAALNEEKANLEAQINAVRRSIYSNSAGVFSHYLDGFEELITPYNMYEFTPDEIDELISESLKEKKYEGHYICKVADNFRYFVAVAVDAEFASDLAEGKSVTLRFPELSGSSFNAAIHSIGEEADGRKVVIFETNRYVDSLILKRTASVEIIKSKYSGFRISVNSIKTYEGTNGVFAVREGSMRFVPIEILYNTSDSVIVKSADSENPLKLYDEIVVKADSYEEGKTVRE